MALEWGLGSARALLQSFSDAVPITQSATATRRETADQQRMSADSVVQWANACCEADAIIAPPGGIHRELGATVETQELLSSYTAYCRQRSLSTVDDRRFWSECA